MTVRTAILATTFAWLALAAPGRAQQGDGTNVAISTAIWKPDKVPATSNRLAQLARAVVGLYAQSVEQSAKVRGRIARKNDLLGRHTG